MDFVYYDEITSERKIFYFESKELKEMNFSDIILLDKDICLLENPKIPIARKHSSAFVDINGDCVSDMLIHSKMGNKVYLEIWIGMKIDNEIKYCLKEKKIIDNKLGLFSLVDINVDGQLDLAFPITESQPPQVYIAYNQIKVENDWSINYCETAQEKKYNISETLFSDLRVDSINNVIIKYFYLNLFIF